MVAPDGSWASEQAIAFSRDAADQPPMRGRDPWVFRCIFEDRSRMVILAPAENLWIAFNPFTCGVHKVWRGEMLFRGKVWDFSQDNCGAKGDVLLEASDVLLSLPDPPGLAQGWKGQRVATDGFAFRGDGATLTSPPFDTTGWSRLFLAFDELSRRGPIRVEVSSGEEEGWECQWFDSCTHVDSDDAWQWNFKELLPRGQKSRIRFVQEKGEYQKHVRGVRVFGDKAAWTATCPGGELPVNAEFKGYRLINRTEGVELLYRLRIGRDGAGDHSDSVAADVKHRIDARPAGGGALVTESITVEGLPEGVSVSLQQPGGKGKITRTSGKRAAATVLVFDGGRAATIEVTTEVQP